MVDRRKFVTAVAGALLTLPLAIEAQQARKMPRIGYLGQNSAESAPHLLVAFRQALGERGWVEGQNILIEYRYADGKVDRLPALVAELIGRNVDVIVTVSSRATWAAKDATKSIPIVMAASVDALGEGLVASLAHPGGNVTGLGASQELVETRRAGAAISRRCSAKGTQSEALSAPAAPRLRAAG